MGSGNTRGGHPCCPACPLCTEEPAGTGPKGRYSLCLCPRPGSSACHRRVFSRLPCRVGPFVACEEDDCASPFPGLPPMCLCSRPHHLLLFLEPDPDPPALCLSASGAACRPPKLRPDPSGCWWARPRWSNLSPSHAGSSARRPNASASTPDIHTRPCLKYSLPSSAPARFLCLRTCRQGLSAVLPRWDPCLVSRCRSFLY